MDKLHSAKGVQSASKNIVFLRTIRKFFKNLTPLALALAENTGTRLELLKPANAA